MTTSIRYYTSRTTASYKIRASDNIIIAKSIEKLSNLVKELTL